MIIIEHEGDGDTSCNWYTWNNLQRLGKGTESVGNRKMSRDHPNYSIIEVDQNTVKSPEDMGRFTVTQTPVKNHQLTRV